MFVSYIAPKCEIKKLLNDNTRYTHYTCYTCYNLLLPYSSFMGTISWQSYLSNCFSCCEPANPGAIKMPAGKQVEETEALRRIP